MKTFLRFKWAILLFLLGCGTVVWLVLSIFWFVTEEPMATFVAPGEAVVKVQKPREYVIWSQSRATVDGRLRSYAYDLPAGAVIAVSKMPEGTAVPVVATGNVSENVNGVHRVSVCTFVAASPGDYRVSVAGFSEERVFSVSPERLWGFLARLFIGSCLYNVFFLAGIGLGIYVLVRVIIDKSRAAG